ncbi:hypothetical protein CL656_05230 [bacterium]|nr:hypothetical protein [bacterium]
MFSFDSTKYLGVLKRNEYLIIRNGCTKNFLTKLDSLLSKILEGDNVKTFSLIPDQEEMEVALKVFSDLSGDKELTISRHHLMHYRPGMTSNPHKDRKSLQYGCAIGVDSPEDSKLLLWPDGNLDENTGNHYRDYIDSLGGVDKVNDLVSQTKPQEIFTGKGDLVFFPASKMFHCRKNPLGSSVYYLDVNSYGLNDREASMQERRV